MSNISSLYQPMSTGASANPAPLITRNSLGEPMDPGVVYLKTALKKPLDRSLSVGKSTRIVAEKEEIPVESYKEYNAKNTYKGASDKKQCCLLF